ncbi:hypothetical protein AGOR_G00129940 [Albula goreensis]|uniref:Delta(14)-sterol reductase TM7SF2 n=1 Tax=Albula goreensis TaxID=1534307 RepID=A0A8T3DE21_9TELE|nr:hypothetical protein AGOR_G00129940 [Albula goreensis]
MMEMTPPSDQVNGSVTHRRVEVKNEEPSQRVRNGSRSTEPEVHPVWNNIHLLVVCTLLSALLILFLEGCRPPSESWTVFGPARVPLWDWGALQIVMAFTVLQGVLYYLPFGKVVEGKMGHDGTRIKYSINGMYALAVTALPLLGLWCGGMFQASMVSGRVPQLVFAGTLISLVFATYLYLSSLHTDPTRLVHYGEGGNFLQEFALGRITDPSVGRIDLKLFFMGRIGFIGWALVDLCYLLTEIERQGVPNLSLLLIVTFQLYYILDFFIDEVSVLPTKEYTEDGIGFIMILGEYIWIPFFTSGPVYFMLQRPAQLSLLTVIPICCIYIFGLLVYHLSNMQKNGFRKNPNDPAFAHLETIHSPTGRNLLVSGWFGWVRHPNYLGDILMNLGWSLPCGFSSPLAYLPFLHCCNLLRRRANDNESACLERHGTAWQEYCQRVPNQLVPGVY